MKDLTESRDGVNFPVAGLRLTGNDFNNMSLVQYAISRQTFHSAHWEAEGETENVSLWEGGGQSRN